MPWSPGPSAPTVIGGRSRGDRIRTGPQGATATVALQGDRPAVLRRTAAWLGEHATDLEVVLTAGTWPELVRSAAFPADLVVLDVQRREPVPLAAQVRACRAAGAQVVVHTAVTDPALRERALQAGAAAWLPASAAPEEVLAALRDVLGITGGAAVQRAWRPAAEERVQRPRLSAGEAIALKLYAEGRSVKEVAAGMSVQYETAKTYLRRIREKYARVDRPAGRRAELVARAAEDGYLD